MNREFIPLSEDEATKIRNMANQIMEHELKNTLTLDAIKSLFPNKTQVCAVHKAIFLYNLIVEKANAEAD